MADIVPVNGSPIASPIRGPGMGGTSNGQVPVGTAPTPTNTVMPNTGVVQNPYAAPTVNGLPPGSVQTSPVNWTDGSNTVLGDMNDVYGKGSASGIASVLQNLGTTNDTAIQALINNTNLEAGKQYSNIQATQAASGITPNSSSAALAAGDFYSSVNSNLQSTVAGMEQNQENTLLQTLLQTGEAHGPDETTFQHVMDALGTFGGAIGPASQGASAAVSALSPTASTGILDALGALAI